MKTGPLIWILLGFNSALFAQGTIVYYNRVVGSVVAPVYGEEVGDQSVFKWGNTTAGFPAGTQTYSGPLLAGTGYTASLWAGPADTPEWQLTLVPGSLRHFRTGGFAGAIDNSGGIITIPGVPQGSSAALQLRAWDNLGGVITSWEQAISTWDADTGQSQVFNSLPLGGLAPPPNMEGLQSFMVWGIPEPGTMLFTALGVTMLWLFRKRKPG